MSNRPVTSTSSMSAEIVRDMRERGYELLHPLFDSQAAWMADYNAWSGRSIVEYGAYDGRHSEVALHLGAEHATAIELLPGRLSQAKPEWPERLTMITADIRTSRKSYDISLMFGILYHLSDPACFLEDAAYRTQEAILGWTHTGNDEQWSSGESADGVGRWISEATLCNALTDGGFAYVTTQPMPTPINNHPAVLFLARRYVP